MIYWFSQNDCNAAFFQNTQQHSRPFKQSQLAPTPKRREGKSTIPASAGCKGNLLKPKIELSWGLPLKRTAGPAVLGDICWILWMLFLSTHFSQKANGFEAVKNNNTNTANGTLTQKDSSGISQTRAAVVFVSLGYFPLSLSWSWNILFSQTLFSDNPIISCTAAVPRLSWLIWLSSLEMRF